MDKRSKDKLDPNEGKSSRYRAQLVTLTTPNKKPTVMRTGTGYHSSFVAAELDAKRMAEQIGEVAYDYRIVHSYAK